MKPYVFDIDPANVDPDGLADGNSSAGATLTLDGALTSGGTFTSADGLAHRISILDLGADDQSGATYSLVGTDGDGLPQTEDITGPTASATVESTKYWLTIEATPAIASPVAGSTVDVGTVDEIVTETLPMNYRAHEAATYATDVTGTVNFDVQETLDEVHLLTSAGVPIPPSTLNWISLTSMTGDTASDKQIGVSHSTACRLVINSYTDTAEIELTAYQNED